MAEESIESSFTLKTKLEKGNPRRNSTGIVKGSSIGQSSSPNYLRASTGSCHEFCKYGKEYTFAVKARNPKPKRITPPSDKQKKVETEVLGPKKKSLVGKPNPSPDVKIHSPRKNVQAVVLPERKKTLQVKLKTSPDLLHSPDPPEVIKREISFPLKKVEVSSKQNSSNNKFVKDKELKITSTSKHSPALKSKSAMVRLFDPSNASVGSNSKRKLSTSPKITGTSKTAVKKVLPPSNDPLSPKSSASKIYTIMSRLKDQNRAGKAKTKILENEKVQEKTLHVVEAETVNNNLKSVQVDDVIQISSPKSSSNPDSQLISSEGDGVEESEYFDKEDLQQFESTDTEDLEESDYCESEADDSISETDEIVNINRVDTSNYSSRPKEGGATSFEDEDTVLAKSKFRRGRIVDLNSDNNIPTRLRFRRGRVVVKDERKSYARRRNFKMREVRDEASGTSPSSEKVVLRHQDVQGKKDAQGLFNNVIEETASKLVESRKSKVKALVGAFETVISLQETKPSTPTSI